MTCGVVVAASLGVRFAALETVSLEPAALQVREPASPRPVSLPLQAPSAAGATERVPMIRAGYYWSREAIAALVANGSDVNVRGGAAGETPLLYAVIHGEIDLIVPLLEAGADPLMRDFIGRDSIGELMHLWHPGYLRSVRALVARVRPSEDLGVIEMIAAGDSERFARWLEADPDLEVHWDLERTPLLWASYYDRPEMARELIARGARIDATDYRDDSPLHFAATHGNRALVRDLLAAGVELNAANAYGQTPLALSLFAPDIETLRDLLAVGADPCIGPRGRSDVPDAARTSMAENATLAIERLEPVVARAECPLTLTRARRDNALEFTARLKQLTPPPRWMTEGAAPRLDFANGDDLIGALEGDYGRIVNASSPEEFDTFVRHRRARAYRAVLDHPDDESFAFTGSMAWTPKYDAASADTVLAIGRLRAEYFFHYQVDEACPICDPGEHTEGNRRAVSLHSDARALLRAGHLLEAVDVLEKFRRERINETTGFMRTVIYENLVRIIWLLGREREAVALAEAEVMRRYGSDSKKAGNCRLATIVKHMRDEADPPDEVVPLARGG
jgi:ankyrin repeat protein